MLLEPVRKIEEEEKALTMPESDCDHIKTFFMINFAYSLISSGASYINISNLHINNKNVGCQLRIFPTP